MTKKTAEQVEESVEEEIEATPSEFIEISVDDVDLKIPTKKLGSWKYFTLLKKQIESNQAVALASDEQKKKIAYGNLLDASIDLVTFVCGENMDAIMGHLGELASYNEVMTFYNKIIKAINAKN